MRAFRQSGLCAGRRNCLINNCGMSRCRYGFSAWNILSAAKASHSCFMAFLCAGRRNIICALGYWVSTHSFVFLNKISQRCTLCVVCRHGEIYLCNSVLIKGQLVKGICKVNRYQAVVIQRSNVVYAFFFSTLFKRDCCNHIFSVSKAVVCKLCCDYATVLEISNGKIWCK